MPFPKIPCVKFMVAMIVVVAGFADPAAAGRRVAFVVGNGDYQYSNRLTNAVADARGMRTALTNIGFAGTDIVYGENLTKRDFERALARFATGIAGSEAAVVFYSGHGSTFDGVPYAVPVDAQFAAVDGMRFELVGLDTMLNELRRAPIGIAIFDACRTNVGEQQLKQRQPLRGEVSRGLAPPGNTDGLLVAFSTRFGATAADGPPGTNSPFTAALLQQLQVPGLDVVNLFRNVGRMVKERTGGVQNPALQIDGFYDQYPLNTGADVPHPVTVPSIPPPASSRVQLSGFIFPDSDQRRLSDAEISQLQSTDLRIARNEIFARRGIYFKSPDLKAHFEKFSWYQPRTWNPELNEFERWNVTQLQEREQLYPSSPSPPALVTDREFIFADSDRRQLTPGELNRLSKRDLRIARNEIYARRGRYFDAPDLKDYFGRFSWYRPRTWDVELNPVERRNIDLVAEEEQRR